MKGKSLEVIYPSIGSLSIIKVSSYRSCTFLRLIPMCLMFYPGTRNVIDLEVSLENGLERGKSRNTETIYLDPYVGGFMY